MDSHDSLAEQFGHIYGRRREWREYNTAEIAIRTTHNRRKYLTRAGVIVAFALSMIILPIVGTLSPVDATTNAASGKSLNRNGNAIEALMGPPPALASSALPLPSVDDTARAIATSTHYTVSNYLPDCDGSTEWEGTNGNLTPDSLCTLWDGTNQVRSDAAVALAELNHQYKLRFHENMCFSSSYRTYADQLRVKAIKGWLAADPGTSFHGWGLAVDFCREQVSGESGAWLKENGPVYGWINPPWASTVKYEPWHWEYEPGTHCFGMYAGNVSDGCPVVTSSVGGGKKK